jgi:hypothetical protein
VAVKGSSEMSQSLAGVGDENVGNRDARFPLTDDGHRSLPNRIRDEIVAVGIEAPDGHEKVAGPDLARVVSQAGDVHVYATMDFFVG